MTDGGAAPLGQPAPANPVSVDISIPTLGESPYLRESIDSVLAQSLESWRLVISENGVETEKVRRIVAPYLDDPRVSYVVTGSRLSLPGHWSRVIRFGDAPYVAMLHDDDRWAPDFLERRVAFLDQHQTCGLAFAGHVMIDDEGSESGTLTLDFDEGVLPPSFSVSRLFLYNFVGPPSVVVRRSAYETVGPDFREILLPDHEMWLRIAARMDIGFLEGWDSEYRVYSGQTTARRRLEMGQARLDVIEATKDLPIPAAMRERARGEAHLTCALDDVELAERRRSLGHLGQAVAAEPSVLLSPRRVSRMLIILGAVATGERGRKRFARHRVDRFLQRSSTTTADDPPWARRITTQPGE